MLAETSTKWNKNKFFTGYLIIGLMVFGAMRFCDCKSVYNELVPDTSSCVQFGNHACLCDNNKDCNQTQLLECIDGRCTCINPLRRKFDESLERCVALVGSSCNDITIGLGRRSIECVRNSECEAGRCLCREGYSRTLVNECKIRHGEECGNNLCNSDRGLACKEGTCQCKDSSYVYSAIISQCIDPEAVVRDLIQNVADRVFREVINFKIRRAIDKILAPLRMITFGLIG